MDIGTEYRSIILCEDEEQLDMALASREAKQVFDTLLCLADKLTHGYNREAGGRTEKTAQILRDGTFACVLG